MNKLRKKDGGEEGHRERCNALGIVFFARIKTLQYMAKLFRQQGIKCLEFHSKMDQRKREQTLFDFQCGKIPTLLSTDIAARGLHIKNVRFIINFDFPISLEQYVHRCGRAGRDNIPQKTSPTSSQQQQQQQIRKDDSHVATVYSFFHRELAPMAKSVLMLLKQSSATTWIDPNLIQLVHEYEQKNNYSGKDQNDDDAAEEDDDMKQEGRKKKSSKRRRKHSKKSKSSSTTTAARNDDKSRMITLKDDNENHNDWVDNDNDDDDDNAQFASLNGTRIIFQRASHVSDAEDSNCE